jgi:hypothetical protein
MRLHSVVCCAACFCARYGLQIASNSRSKCSLILSLWYSSWVPKPAYGFARSHTEWTL